MNFYLTRNGHEYTIATDLGFNENNFGIDVSNPFVLTTNNPVNSLASFVAPGNSNSYAFQDDLSVLHGTDPAGDWTF